MENNDNNNLSELDQLKAQYETLKQQFDQQEIVNDRLMKSSVKHGTDFYRRYRVKNIIMYPLVAIIGLIGIKLCFGNNLSLLLFWGAFILTCLVIELILTRKFQRKTLENEDLLALSNTARSFKKLFSVFTVLNYFTGLILICGLLMSLVGENYNGRPMMLTFFAVVVGMIALGIAEVHFKTRSCDEIIRHIEAAEPAANRKTGFDMRQKWFYVAMIVVFLGFDVWAYTIVGSYLKLPPMWRTVKYERAFDDDSSEGKLEIWDVDADTLAISSAMMNGKPMVKMLTVNKPCKYPSAESVPMTVRLTPDASRLWYLFTSNATGSRAALYLDGVKVQEWNIQCGIDKGFFFIMREWSSKDELEAFCERMMRQ